MVRGQLSQLLDFSETVLWYVYVHIIALSWTKVCLCTLRNPLVATLRYICVWDDMLLVSNITLYYAMSSLRAGVHVYCMAQHVCTCKYVYVWWGDPSHHVCLLYSSDPLPLFLGNHMS